VARQKWKYFTNRLPSF